MKNPFLIIAGICLLSGSALAADLGDAPAERVDQPERSSISWTGLYVGGHFGYGFSDTTWNNESGNPYSNPFAFAPLTILKEGFSPQDPIAGGQIGANYQMGRWVFGTEVSFTGTGLEESRPISPGAFNQPSTTTLQTDIRSQLLATARLGYALDDRWLAYVKGGYAGGDVHTSGKDTSFANYSFESNEWSSGWTIGAGAELRLSDIVSIGLEYAHINLGDQGHFGIIATLPDFPVKTSVSTQIDTVTARLNLKLYR
jgi:opacity protein-like surface antigen